MIDKELKEEVFHFLNCIRESGKINMMEAPKYIEKYFRISDFKSTELFLDWCKTFEDVPT